MQASARSTCRRVGIPTRIRGAAASRCTWRTHLARAAPRVHCWSVSTELAHLDAALTGRYRIERVLGAGGMATVYLAHDGRHERPVALKVLRPEVGAALGAERFLAEIRVTAHLHHPHLVPLFDSGEAGGVLFYVMPYIEG